MEYTLVGVNGNAFAVMGYVIKAMKDERYDKDAIKKYQEDATSSDYDHLVSVSLDMIHNINLKLRGE